MEEIIFGSYPQKPDEYVNGKRISIVDGKPQFNPLENQPIEWLVVSEDEEKMLLVSKHILECLPFNDWDTFDISWENCTLRAWMNGAFKYDEKSFADYFTEEEKEVFKRGRNDISHVPSSSDRLTYEIASGLEAICGYLYLTDQDRMNAIFEEIFKGGIEYARSVI